MSNKRHYKNKLKKRNRKKITPYGIAKMERRLKITKITKHTSFFDFEEEFEEI